MSDTTAAGNYQRKWPLVQLAVLAGILFLGWTSFKREQHLEEVCNQVLRENGQHCTDSLHELGDICIEQMKRCGCVERDLRVRFVP